ncbi:EAL domain-containing protein [Hyphomicrobium sp. LHD-15]|uniref:putative bifunctional diguanylate cyclase/phosphodiesterase n=1 Tax=Hyphomicrobium sp. LHD-15 TaxID=3072142 RepID=UPI00280D980A|nr:EAL domain-containing protein [Hyphomicrobium sp. LHD-15]MDQ8697462.1 EAL domain-containing protein [Hyphomicrobium sp. LHD-15]
MGVKNKVRSRTVGDRLKDLQHEILIAIASGKPLADVMALLCARAEKIAPKAICSIIRVDSTGRLRPLAAPSLPQAYSDAIDGAAIGPMVGSCGTAAYLGEPVEVTNIKTDPRWEDYKEAALALGFKACWSSPIKSHDDRVIGTFAFYFRTARRANQTEKRIVAHCAHLCTLAIEHWAAQNRIRRLAFTDALTGLGSRALLAEKFPEILKHASETGKEVALFYVDIDGFRAINAVQGHRVGDQLLRAITQRIRSVAASAELGARLGADEFLVVYTARESHSEFEVMASALAEALRNRYVLEDGLELKAAASIGVACFPNDGSDLDTLISEADTALNQVKRAGRAGYAFYSPRMDAEKRARQAFERDVSVAVSAGQLSVLYQPQADAHSCSVRGFEALLRWKHPIHGFVSPDKFIPAAEACGAIEGIGAFVLREALQHAADWPKHLRVAVNVSPAQIIHADFAELVERTLSETGVDPRRLEIEVTESLFIFDEKAALKTLERLKALGVSVAMDDFGTGYSSLRTLRSFPFDRIKIDRSFIFDMVANADAAAIVNSIMGLGRALGRPVVAEGVETKEQLELLQLQGCNEVQGYLIGKPLPIEAYSHVTGLSGASGKQAAEATPSLAAGYSAVV